MCITIYTCVQHVWYDKQWWLQLRITSLLSPLVVIQVLLRTQLSVVHWQFPLNCTYVVLCPTLYVHTCMRAHSHSLTHTHTHTHTCAIGRCSIFCLSCTSLLQCLLGYSTTLRQSLVTVWWVWLCSLAAMMICLCLQSVLLLVRYDILCSAAVFTCMYTYIYSECKRGEWIMYAYVQLFIHVTANDMCASGVLSRYCMAWHNIQ